MQYLEGEYPLANVLNNHGDTYFTSYEPAVLDDVTDLLMLQTAFQQREGNPLVMAMDMRGYPRYWHGYVSIIRPLFYFIDYLDVRVVNCFVQLLLVFGMAFTVWKRAGSKRYVLAFLTSYALLMPLALPFSMQYSWVFYISFGGMGISAHLVDCCVRQCHERKRESEKNPCFGADMACGIWWFLVLEMGDCHIGFGI